MAFTFRSNDGNWYRADSRDQLIQAAEQGHLGPETGVVDGAGTTRRAADLPELRELFGAFGQASIAPSSATAPQAPMHRPRASVWPEAGLNLDKHPDEPAPEPENSPLAELEVLAIRRRSERAAKGKRSLGLVLPAVVIGGMVGLAVGLAFWIRERDPASELMDPKLSAQLVAPPRTDPDWAKRGEGAERYTRLRTRVPTPPIHIGTAAELQSEIFRLLLNAEVAPGTIRMAVDEVLPAAVKSMERPRRIRLIIELPYSTELDPAERVAQTALIFGPYVDKDRLIISELSFVQLQADGSETRHDYDHHDLSDLWRGSIDLADFLDRSQVPRDRLWDPLNWNN